MKTESSIAIKQIVTDQVTAAALVSVVNQIAELCIEGNGYAKVDIARHLLDLRKKITSP